MCHGHGLLVNGQGMIQGFAARRVPEVRAICSFFTSVSEQARQFTPEEFTPKWAVFIGFPFMKQLFTGYPTSQSTISRWHPWLAPAQAPALAGMPCGGRRRRVGLEAQVRAALRDVQPAGARDRRIEGLRKSGRVARGSFFFGPRGPGFPFGTVLLVLGHGSAWQRFVVLLLCTCFCSVQWISEGKPKGKPHSLGCL